MQITIFYILISSQFFLSCKEQIHQSHKIDSSDVKEITIVNKVYCSSVEFVRKKVIITERNQINNIIETFSYAKLIKQKDVGLNRNNGFFEIEFYEGEEEHSYDVVYTIYDGIVVVNSNNGDCFKNDLLEVKIYKLFIE